MIIDKNEKEKKDFRLDIFDFNHFNKDKIDYKDIWEEVDRDKHFLDQVVLIYKNNKKRIGVLDSFTFLFIGIKVENLQVDVT